MFTADRKSRDCVFGFFRQNASKSRRHVPKDITNICCEYYICSETLAVGQAKSTLTLSADGRSVSHCGNDTRPGATSDVNWCVEYVIYSQQL